MSWLTKRISRRGLLALALGGATVTAAGAATYHRLSVSQSTGSGGATNFLQSATSSSALEGNVGTADTTYGTPFGVFGVYNTTSSTFGIGVLGASSTGYGIAGESLSNTQPSILAYPGGNGPGLEATTTSSSTNPAILSVSKGAGDGVDGVSTSGSGVYALNNATGDSVNNGVQVGLYAASTIGNAIYAKAGSSVGAFFANASDFYTMVIQNAGQGPILIAESSNCVCLTLDGSGNLAVNGTITDKNGTFARTRNPSSDLVTYGAETTQPTVEDVGRAQLTGGSGGGSRSPRIFAKRSRVRPTT